MRAPRASHFLTVPNATLRDARLSRRARGLLVELLSYADGWETNSDDLARIERGPEGRDAIRGALRELESTGYLLRARVRDEGGRWATVSAVHDTPQAAGSLPPGVDPDDLVGAADRDGKSVPAPTSDDAPAEDNAAGQTGTGSPASDSPASVDQALREKTSDEDPPSPGLTVVRGACALHPAGDGKRCRGCGTAPSQLRAAAARARAAEERAAAAHRRALERAADAQRLAPHPTSPAAAEAVAKAREVGRASRERYGSTR